LPNSCTATFSSPAQSPELDQSMLRRTGHHPWARHRRPRCSGQIRRFR